MIPDIPEYIRYWNDTSIGYRKLVNPSSTIPFFTNRMPCEMQVKEVVAQLDNAENSIIIIDVKASGESILSEPLKIKPGKTEGKELSNVSLGDDEEIQLFWTTPGTTKEETKIKVGFDGYQKVNQSLARKGFAKAMRALSKKDFDDDR